MAVGNGDFPSIAQVDGLRLGVAEAGIKYSDRKDLVAFEICDGASVAGVFTLNAFCAAPVTISKKHLSQTQSRMLVINTGNANAGTGKQGMLDAERMCSAMAHVTGLRAEQVLPFSTGVIGEPLAIDKIVNAMPALVESFGQTQWEDVARGIMTTDTRPKGAFREFTHDNKTYVLAGVSKGAGMIKPNMATMLGFIATDLNVETTFLQSLLKEVTDQSFNRITIDSDTSTNDSCILIATGKANNEQVVNRDSELAAVFIAELTAIMQELAHAIVRDGEGATKFVEIEVSGAATVEEATKVAFEIGHSPLVKTALFASDPNWGRILAVVGRAGIDSLNVDRVQILINDVQIVEDGGRASSYTEALGQQAMAPEEIKIQIKLGRGDKIDRIWTTDLSHEYVTINAEYRT
jgi:glutamate N-acetyltransferase/amino-acid N-acetyltransferase